MKAEKRHVYCGCKHRSGTRFLVRRHDGLPLGSTRFLILPYGDEEAMFPSCHCLPCLSIHLSPAPALMLFALLSYQYL
jgi:hypothetical protein